MTSKEYNKCVYLYTDNVYRFILKQINNEEKAKDIMQDILTNLWVKVKTVSFEKAKSYLFTSAHNSIIDMIRKDRIDSDIDVNKNSRVYIQDPPDLKEKLDQELSKLPDIHRSVILLRDHEGYSYEEIGQITGLSKQQVKVYIFRARNIVKKRIGSIETLI